MAKDAPAAPAKDDPGAKPQEKGPAAKASKSDKPKPPSAEPLKNLPAEAPGRRDNPAHDKRMAAYAREVALNSPCELHVREGSTALGDHPSNEGLLLIEATIPGGAGAVSIGSIPEGEKVAAYLDRIREAAKWLIETRQVEPRRRQMEPGALDQVDETPVVLDDE